MYDIIITSHETAVGDTTVHPSNETAVCEHQTKTSHSIDWEEVKLIDPEEDQGGHLHLTPETIFEQRQDTTSPSYTTIWLHVTAVLY